jgi:hypothetical protein
VRPIRDAEQRPIGANEHVLDKLYRLHCALDWPSVIDSSAGKLSVWNGAQLRPEVAIDIEPRHPGVVEADWLEQPRLYLPGRFHGALWDPIFVPNAGNGIVGSYRSDRNLVKGKNIVALFQPYLEAVRPILDPRRGTLVVKMIDLYTAGSDFQPQVFELWRIARELEWKSCGYLTTPRGAAVDPKWKRQRSLPIDVTWWLVFHVADRCPQKLGLPRPTHHRCVVCGTAFLARSIARTCSDKCRSALRRRRTLNP